MVDDLLDWLIDKQRQGYKMVDSIARLQNMKGFMRGVGEHWGAARAKTGSSFAPTERWLLASRCTTPPTIGAPSRNKNSAANSWTK